jgi:DnaJ-class molecular chaperone
MQGFNPGWWVFVQRLREAELNAPRLCGRCGGRGECYRWWRRSWRQCRACHGTGGAVDDERAWWTGARR